MSRFLDESERRDPALREADLLGALPCVIAAATSAPAVAIRLAGIDPGSVRDRAALARLPLLRKSDLPGIQAEHPPFGGLSAEAPGLYARLFTSPGPIYEGEKPGPDPWNAAPAFRAAGFGPGDVVLNTFSYHMTPGGFIMDGGARALGCAVIPAGPGQTEAQLDLVRAFRPSGYCGTPDFLHHLLGAADAAGSDATSLRRALVSGAAFPASLRSAFSSRGIDGFEAYATADLGVIAFETEARAGLVVNEGLLVEIVRPGTGDPVPEGEVGEVVVTAVDPVRPMIRLATGDLSAILPGPSPCGRTGARLRGWLGRADQAAKVRGMFVRPEQVAEIGRRHPEVGRLRLRVSRDGEADAMTLLAESAEHGPALETALRDTLRAVTMLGGRVELVAAGSLPNDGRVVADERPMPA